MATAVASPVVTWPDAVDGILGGDLVVALGMPTPRGGVAMACVTPLGLRDRERGTVAFTTSLGFGRKLERIAADPRIAVAYHTRRHGHTDTPGYLLVQGTAAIDSRLSEAERQRLGEIAATHIGQIAEGRFWDWWLKVYYQDRVMVTVRVHRMLWWPDGDLRTPPQLFGDPLPDRAPPGQSPPRRPDVPRVPARRVARSARLPHRLLGVLLADGMPLVLPVDAAAGDATGLTLACASSLVPAGGRRAGLLTHDFRPKLLGLTTATHTGWLQASSVRLHWTPHTRHFFYAPPNKTLLLLGNGLAARVGYRRALRQGRDTIIQAGRH